jgi:hypothetical protein
MKSATGVLMTGAAIMLLIPALVFVFIGLGSGMGMSGVGAALLQQFTAPRVNLAVSSLLGVLPILLLAIILWLRARLVRQPQGQALLALGAVLPIGAVTLFVNIEAWSSFLPQQAFPGFPHGLELVLGPLVFAPVGMLGGLVLAWLVMRFSK